VSKGSNRRQGKGFEDNFDAIFGDKPVERGSFIQTAEGIVPRGTEIASRVNAPMVMKPLGEFKSPIDGQIISNRTQLAAHNKKHGVTNTADYSNGYVEKQAHKRVNAGRKDVKDSRTRDIKRLVDTVININS
jgi:hypothetical protein